MIFINVGKRKDRGGARGAVKSNLLSLPVKGPSVLSKMFARPQNAVWWHTAPKTEE